MNENSTRSDQSATVQTRQTGQGIHERRRFHRVVTDRPTLLTVGGKAFEGTVVDISLRGLLVETDGKGSPAVDDPIHASVQLDGALCCIELDGTVAHVNGRLVGIHCVQIDIDSAAVLRRLVELNLADEEALERELEELIADASS